MANFISIPSHEIETFLQNLKFERGVQGQEVTYSRRSKRNPDVVLKVYTSIRVDSSAVRSAGRDSIKVCVIFDARNRSFGIGRFPPVLRVHSIKNTLDRLFERLHEATKRANQWISEEERRHGPHPESKAWRERLEEKAQFAAKEQRDEEQGFMSDPDYQEYVDNSGEPPSSCYSYEDYKSFVTNQ